ncbi:hypothetical protein [Falsiphaeobacter marinintestinus]|uniref:hypothetical protein n=1 Tax=Falsiphaeobacter marinintestinus TaxID=1492905 RepID=UPI0011B66209|nr:hypothetical protein [Phaeobacter marinintestinus]
MARWVMTDASGGSIWKEMKSVFEFGSYVLTLSTLLHGSGCTFGVDPNAGSVAGKIAPMERYDAEIWLQSKGFRQLHPEARGPRLAGGECREDFDPSLYTVAQFGSALVRVCFDQKGDVIVLQQPHRSQDWHEAFPISGTKISANTQQRLIQ